ncbi:anion permease [Mesoterricola silvestris]|uniref:Malate transporter YflS n=1 Tax=Mesoterricola silvestris TaxID=2927979 RepID=A0AA48GNM3_9BACT|nr:anion permease [Mesoterricola silvestris]BDU74649.1 putative malate transporter YflS [Mesoterricola silvestris]
MSTPTPEKSGWQGAKPLQLFATVLVGCLLYFVLPRLAPVPDAKLFAGSAGAKAAAAKKDKTAKPAPDKAAKPAVDKAPAPAAEKASPSAKDLAAARMEAEVKAKVEAGLKARAEAEAKTKAEADAKAKADAEKLRREDWVRALHLFAIFVATILGIILRPLPMGAVAIIGVGLTAITGTLSIGESLSGFSEKTLWLIIVAFMFARGFIKTGLGTRIAYFFMRLLGRRTLGLAYGLAATEFCLAPVVPSNTARTAGIIMPIMRSLARAYGSNPGDGTERRMGAYLTMTCFNIDLIVSAMFLTAMAANPMAQKFAADFGVTITWSSWFVAAIVPGLVGLLVIPYVFYKLYRPGITETPEAVEMATAKLREMGRLSMSEWLMTGVFAVVLLLWVFGEKFLGMDGTTAALLGLGLLLLTGVLHWTDVLAEHNAWDVLIWTGGLIMMAGFLNKLGMIPWFSKVVGASMAGHGWIFGFLVLCLTYFYAHYFFASMTAHVGAMYAAFLGVSITLGAPPMLAALVLCFFSNLHASMTHYGTGPAAAMFGMGYVPIGTWWRLGFIVSLVNIAIWVFVGGAWWKVLGLW